MPDRSSLLDDASFNSIGAPRERKPSRRAEGASRKKIALALLGIAMSGGWLGYFYVLKPRQDLRRAQDSIHPLSDAEERSYAAQQAERAAADNDPTIMKPGP